MYNELFLFKRVYMGSQKKNKKNKPSFLDTSSVLKLDNIISLYTSIIITSRGTTYKFRISFHYCMNLGSQYEVSARKLRISWEPKYVKRRSTCDEFGYFMSIFVEKKEQEQWRKLP